MNEPRSTPIEVHVSLIGRKDITNEIYRQLRAAILDGRLKSGDRLPPTRELAARLSVSRTTVMDVYDRLFSEGYTEARTGSGTRVSSELMRVPAPAAPPSGALRARQALGLDRHPPGRSNARLSSTSGLAPRHAALSVRDVEAPAGPGMAPIGARDLYVRPASR